VNQISGRKNIKKWTGLKKLITDSKCVLLLKKVKVLCNRPEGPDGGGGLLLFLDLGARRGWAVSTMPWPLYPQERASTH
jgi:hypothetical protein